VLLLFFIAVLFSIYLSAITDALQRGWPCPARPAFSLPSPHARRRGRRVYLIVPPVLQQSQELIQAMPR
jgi:predicted PurR-regulated permease PerM